MKRMNGRRAVLLSAGTVAVAAVAGAVAVAAQAPDIHGTIAFEGGAAIPKGRIEISIDDPAIQDDAQRAAAGLRVESDGGSKVIDFSLASPEGRAASQGTQIVARLERADGWLLARGSAMLEAKSPVHITLFTAMY